MATDVDLQARGFHACTVTARVLNVDHHDPHNRGPFCRLLVEDTVPTEPGVYAWVRDGTVMYVGMSEELRQVIQGTRMGRPYNDYTYVPASKVKQSSSPRVRINGLLNGAFVAGSSVSWWWLRVDTRWDAAVLEAALISEWAPAWNRSRPWLA